MGSAVPLNSIRKCAGTLLTLMAVGPIHAQYPERPVRIVVPFSAGGGADVQARLAAQALSARLKQPFVVENRVGAGGNVATAFVAQAAPDGYTLLLATPAATINQSLHAKPGYDLRREYAAVGAWSVSPLLFVAHPSVPANNLKELVAYSKANAGKVSYASGGIGLITHLVLEFFKASANLDMLHVPFSGQAPALTAVVGGQVAFTVDSIASSAQSVKAGRVRALANTGRERSSDVADVPTVAEAGFPELTAYAWYGLLAPIRTPPAVLDTLNAAMLESLRDPETRKRIDAVGAKADPQSRADYAKFIDDELTRWQRIITNANLKAQ
jgi:tripartite-type tricarboxylate transporter receptor subunit TctC